MNVLSRMIRENRRDMNLGKESYTAKHTAESLRRVRVKRFALLLDPYFRMLLRALTRTSRKSIDPSASKGKKKKRL